MIHGNMAVGVTGDELMVRVGEEAQAEALAHPGARVFDMTGKPMRGWVIVGAEEPERGSWRHQRAAAGLGTGSR